jgi:3-dehydroquinate dehydratase/shikimate dehydrogenase
MSGASRNGCALVASVSPRDEAELLAAADRAVRDGADLLEVRCDRAGDAFDRWLALLPAVRLPVIVTVRSRAHGGEFDGDESERVRRLSEASRFAAWIDVEAGSAAAGARFEGGGRRIVSLHDWDGTPADLDARADRLRADHPDAVLKLACLARDLDDVARVATTQRRLSAAGIRSACFSLGELGLPTRLLAGRLGAALAYGAIEGHAPTAPGQPFLTELALLHRVREQAPSWSIGAVVGDPIAHSLSPLLHSTLARAEDLERAFVPLRAPDLPSALHAADALGITALSVTLPHKETATRLAAGPLPGEPWPPPGGATNTLMRATDGWRAANTDAVGFAAALDAAPAEAVARVRSALLLGAGGVARTAAAVLIARGIAVTIAARRRDAAQALTAALRRGGDAAAATLTVVPWEQRDRVAAELIVNATPLGMAPAIASSPFPPAALRPGALILDLVYRPRKTQLLRDAERAGAIALDGVTMFLAQAFAQHRRFAGRDPSPHATAAARASVEAALDRTP